MKKIVDCTIIDNNVFKINRNCSKTDIARSIILVVYLISHWLSFTFCIEDYFVIINKELLIYCFELESFDNDR